MSKRFRLIDVLKDLNISMDRAADFLASKGITIKKAPHTKIDENIRSILLKEFESDANKKAAAKLVLKDIQAKAKAKTLLSDTLETKGMSLELTNFRRFQNFGPVDFGDITFLVGSNNSGKSTFVKALMLIINYLQSDDLNFLDFNSRNVEDLNIVTYERAKCKIKSEHNWIGIKFTDNGLSFELTVTGTGPETRALVKELKIKDEKSTIEAVYDIPAKTVEINQAFIDFDRPDYDKIKLNILNEIRSIQDKKSSIKDTFSKEYIDLNKELEFWKKRNELVHQKKSESGTSELILNTHFDSPTGKIFDLENIFSNLINAYRKAIIKQKKLNAKDLLEEDEVIQDLFRKHNEKFENLKFFYQNQKPFALFKDKIKEALEDLGVEYLPATILKQSALFYIRDYNNSVTQTIHEYYQSGVYKSGSAGELFVKKWMKPELFEIGEDIQINLIEGEAYDVKLKSNNLWIPLADKGTGVIQLVRLLLKIGSIIHKADGKSYILMIEEPGINLHPAWQSKLSDLFYEANNRFEIRFIIETHSEYMIRKSQVITAQNEFDNDLNPNPFTVLYFSRDIERNAYSMGYQPDGTFKNNFEEGFFDAAADSAMELIRIRRRNEKK